MVRKECPIGWDFPSNGWIKINYDGYSKGNPGLTAGSGVVRDVAGSWIARSVINLGVCTFIMTECWAAFCGLSVA